MNFYNGQKVTVVGLSPDGKAIHGTLEHSSSDLYPWFFTSDDGMRSLFFTGEGWEHPNNEGNYEAIHMIPYKTSLEKFYEL